MSDSPASMPWRERAACLGEHPDLFFPPGYGARHRADVDAAKAVCAVCPVRAECLIDALNSPSFYDSAGIRAGLDADERAKLRRLRSRNAARQGDQK